MAAAESVTMLLPALLDSEMEAEVIYTGPVQAPIVAGQELGELVIRVPDMEERRVPLLATQNVGTAGIGLRLRTAFEQVMQRVFGGGDPLAG